MNKLFQIIKLVAVTALLIFGFGSVTETPAEKDSYHYKQSVLGNYLAGRFASSQRDTKTAAHYFGKALREAPDSKRLLEQAFLLEVMSANWERSAKLSKRLIDIEPSHSFARLYSGVVQFRKMNFVAADSHFLAGIDGPVGQLIADVSRSWMKASRREHSSALEVLEKITNTAWIDYYHLYHAALIADHGDMHIIARKNYNKLFTKYNRMVRLTENYVNYLYRSGDTQQALGILKKHFSKANYFHPDLVILEEKIKQGAKVERSIGDARKGLAELFYSLGDLRAEGGGEDDGLLFLQIARYLNPGFDLADYALANLFFKQKKFDNTIAVLNNISDQSSINIEVKILRARALSATKQSGKAIASLEQLVLDNKDNFELYNALGKLYLDEEKYANAVTYYSKIIELIKEPKNEHWYFYYGRGIGYERMKEWPKAEKDFKQALRLSPDEPDVLNYLGYSWVDQKLNLREAMKLIRKAVKLKPRSGYYVDSLGWAYYRLGQYHKAVEQLEQAVELRPDDPVINDHLGDVYWRLGRHLEAKYQWKQVLSLEPEDDLKRMIAMKLKIGLSEKRQAKVNK